MSIDQHRLKAYLSPLSDSTILAQIYFYETIPSTNQILWERLKQGDHLPIIALATQQTAGRGQWGRTWQSEAGGLYLSVAMACEIPANHAFHLTLLTAWGIAKALQDSHIPVTLKWPNDLILQGKKLGGIKIETRLEQLIITQAVIGVGINWQNPIPATGINLQPFLARQNQTKITSLEALAALTIQGIFNGYQFYCSQGCDRLLSAYLTCLSSLGRSVIIEGIPGNIVGVTAQGDLTVRLHASGASTEISLPLGSIRLGYED